jgi:hypothetical protein
LENPVLVQFEKYAEGVCKFQPRVASTLGLTKKSDPTLKAFANAIWPTLSALNFSFSHLSQGCRKRQPWAEISERLRRIFELN